MGRRSEGPWWWSQRGCWCATIAGQRVELTRGRESKPEAEREWHRLMAECGHEKDSSDAAPRMDISRLSNLFMDFVEATASASTYETYDRHLRWLREAHGKLQASHLRPYHLDEWVSARGWGQNTRRGVIGTVKTFYRWSKRRGYLDSNPLAEVERPGRLKREIIISPQAALTILANIWDREFRDFVLTIWATGCRPGEACKVEAKDINAKGVWTIFGKTTRKTGRMRRVFPTPEIVELCRKLAVDYPSGPIFRNTEGNPWREDTYGARMRRLRNRLLMGKEAVCYSFRHLFATDMEEAGVSPATVAALMGHSSLAHMATYSKLHTRDDHLHEAVSRRSINANASAPGAGRDARPSAASSASAPTGETPGRHRGPTGGTRADPGPRRRGNG